MTKTPRRAGIWEALTTAHRTLPRALRRLLRPRSQPVAVPSAVGSMPFGVGHLA